MSKKCTCAAWCEAEYACDGVDWRSKREIELEAENAKLRQALESIAKEEETLGWVYAAKIAKAALLEENDE